MTLVTIAVALATKAPGKTMIVQEGQEAHLARMYRLHAGTTMTTMMTVRVSFPKSLFDHSDEIACARLRTQGPSCTLEGCLSHAQAVPK